MTRTRKKDKIDRECIPAKWSCANNECNAVWESSATWVSKVKVENKISAKDLTKRDYAKQKCKKCGNSDNNLEEYPLVIKKLIYEEKWYRVYGLWKCECKNEWASAYTWISLELYKNITPVSELTEHDYFNQDCKTCKTNHDIKDIKLTSYRHLRRRNQDKLPPKRHMSEHCEKCQKHKKCQEHKSSNYPIL
ncbi:4458_t:CDS:1 [Diversispora eburnea]|uniref:4458_t:CDS:1 n=1 Tax=Diversispora eburnea TaxID=1213867 RepID=A0A9N9B1Q4_9GLOM|nr:4458_t:CDS:1 [Diversispora eburnea]